LILEVEVGLERGFRVKVGDLFGAAELMKGVEWNNVFGLKPAARKEEE